MKKLIRAGATDQTIDVFIQDSTSTTGGGKTGLAYNTASLVCYYRKGATGSATALTLATQTVGGSHSDGGFVEIDATNMPGMYRLDLSDTIVATAGSVSMMLKGATGMAPLPIELQVVSFNPEDAVRLGLTALPNAAADAAGGLPISDAGGLDLDAKLANTNEVTAARMGALTDWIDGGRLDLILDARASQTSVDTIDGIVDTILVDTAELQTDWANGGRLDLILDARASQTSVDTIDGIVDTILVDTAELQTDWANGGRLDLILDARASQTSVDDLPTNAELATALASADDATLAAIAALNNLSAAQVNAEVDTAIADAALATAANLAVVAGYLDTEVAAIKAKTDNLPASPAAVGSAMTLTSGERDSVAAALLDLSAGIETGLTPRQALRLIAAAAAGKLSGAATTSVVIRNAVADSKDRITATVDADGNRPAITVDLT